MGPTLFSHHNDLDDRIEYSVIKFENDLKLGEVDTTE